MRVNPKSEMGNKNSEEFKNFTRNFSEEIGSVQINRLRPQTTTGRKKRAEETGEAKLKIGVFFEMSIPAQDIYIFSDKETIFTSIYNDVENSTVFEAWPGGKRFGF